MNLKAKTRRLERAASKWYGAYVSKLSDEAFLSEFLRVCTLDQGHFTVEDILGRVGETGGDAERWRSVMDSLLPYCKLLPGRKSGAPRYRWRGKQ